METNLKKISDLINNQKNIEDEKKFKLASASLVCTIVDINQLPPKKYCKLFQDNLNLPQNEFELIQRELNNDALNIEDKVSYIKNELNNNMYQIMEFLKILNKFAIVNGCTQKSYREFELIRDKFLREFY
jgi:hypothetical protein